MNLVKKCFASAAQIWQIMPTLSSLVTKCAFFAARAHAMWRLRKRYLQVLVLVIFLRYANGNARLDFLIFSMRARSHSGEWHQYPCDGFCKRCTSGNCSSEKFELVNRCALSAWVFMFCVRYAGSFVQQRGVLNSDNNFCGILM